MAPTEQQARQAKALQLAGKKSTKARVQRYLQSTGPQLRERGAKKTLLLHGQRSSQTMHHVLNEWRTLQGPHNTKLLTKKNPIAVFDDAAGQQSLEFLMTKNDAALVVMATHNKKRPNNLILGRSFDRVLLDTVELGVTYFKSMQQYGGAVSKKRVGSKPLLLFQGDVWQRSNDYRQLQNMLTDFYRGDVVDQLVASGAFPSACFWLVIVIVCLRLFVRWLDGSTGTSTMDPFSSVVSLYYTSNGGSYY